MTSTSLEKKMLEQGFASSRMVAKKLLRSQSTVLRMVQAGKLTSKSVTGQIFIEITSVKNFAGAEGVTALDLTDWSDVL